MQRMGNIFSGNREMIIYKIQNKINLKIYIGKTIKSLHIRIIGHLKADTYIGNALRKYGLQSFEWGIIDTATDIEILNEKEKYWIIFHNCKWPDGYNLTDGGDGVSNITEKTRRRQSLSHMGKPSGNKGKHHHHSETTKKKIGMHSYNKRPEAKRKLSERWVGEKNIAKNPKVRKKISESKMGAKNGMFGKHPWNFGLTKETDKRMKMISEQLSHTSSIKEVG